MQQNWAVHAGIGRPGDELVETQEFPQFAWNMDQTDAVRFIDELNYGARVHVLVAQG